MMHQKWNKWVSCFIVGVLVSGMVVDHAAARRLFQRQCRCSCPSVWAESCPPTSSDTSSALASNCPDSLIAADDCPCATTETPVDATSCQHCAVETQPDERVEELSAPVPTPAERSQPAEPDAPTETSAEAADNSVEPPNPQPALAPAPLAVPEASDLATPTSPAPSSPAPAVVEPPTATVVGDRYSNNEATPSPTSPAETTPPEPAVEPAAEKDDFDSLFDDPTPSEDEGTPTETPSETPTETPSEPPQPEPTQAEPAQETSEPQPESNVDDLFGPSTPKAAPADEVNRTEPPSQDAEKPALHQSDPDESDKSYDPFAEDSTSLEDRTFLLQSAGGLRSEQDRTWTDDSATFRCEARLVRVTAKNVVLRQSTGAKLVVPLKRLGNDDLLFVHQQITALRIVHAREAVAEKLALAWAR
ncbi:MAG: hypothetical protein GXP24_05890 [Planctomycetes bacterium]|nr:hypothetical protein [Planctomycetota bacterium]